MTSIFHSFNAPPNQGQVTVCEHGGLFVSAPVDTAKLKVQGYPDISVTKDTTRSLTQRENAKSAFLPHDETVSKRVYHAWQDMGLIGALEEIVNGAEEVPNWVSAVSQKLLVISRWTSSLHGSFFPHLAMSNEEIIAKFSSVVHWSTSPIKAFSWHPHTLKFSYALQDDTVRVHSNFADLVPSLKHTELVPILKHKQQKNVACLAWQPNSCSVLAVGCQSCILIWHVEPTSLATRSGLGTHQRTIDEVKTMWRNAKGRVKEKVNSSRKTGGGAAEQLTSSEEFLQCHLQSRNPHQLDGIPEGAESGKKSLLKLKEEQALTLYTLEEARLRAEIKAFQAQEIYYQEKNEREQELHSINIAILKKQLK